MVGREHRWLFSNPVNGVAVGWTLADMNLIFATLGGLFILHEKKTTKELRFVVAGMALIAAGSRHDKARIEKRSPPRGAQQPLRRQKGRIMSIAYSISIPFPVLICHCSDSIYSGPGHARDLEQLWTAAKRCRMEIGHAGHETRWEHGSL